MRLILKGECVFFEKNGWGRGPRRRESRSHLRKGDRSAGTYRAGKTRIGERKDPSVRNEGLHLKW